MNIADFIEKWNAKLTRLTDKNGAVRLKKEHVITLRVDIHGLRQYDPTLNLGTKYISVFEAAKEWWNAKGLYSIEFVAAKYGIKHDVLNEYISAYLNLKNWVEPFSVNYSIFDLYYFAKEGKQKDSYFISSHETV